MVLIIFSHQAWQCLMRDRNVERFALYLRNLCDKTQFIVITHRRGTMAAATRLYGVTMPEHGISKVLTLDVADISKNKEGSWNGLFN